MSDELVTFQEAAELIGKNLRTIQRHIKSGKLTRHQKDGKNFVSRQEIEKKFPSVVQVQKPPPTSQTPFSERGGDFWQTAAQKYQKSWTQEIEKHAQTREELGEWKGRAEAYQAFAARLLGNGKHDINVERRDMSSKIFSSSFFYIIVAILFIALILVLIIFRLKLAW